MNALKKNIVVALLLMLGVYSAHAQSVLGTVSGELDAGEMYDLYRSSSDSFREYLAGWKYVGARDKTVSYTYDEVYDKCLQKAKRQYSYFTDVDLKDLHYDIEYERLDDLVSHTQEVGSSTEYKRTDRQKKVYKYSATVVVKNTSQNYSGSYSGTASNVTLSTGATVADADEPGTYTWEQAKQRCASKGTGWYLPTKAELNEMYEKKFQLGGFTGNWYWSSSEYDSGDAYGQRFSDGRQGSSNKPNPDGRVRCVRKY